MTTARILRRAVLALTLAILTSGCSSSGSDVDDGSSSLNLNQATYAGTTNGSGVAGFQFAISAGITSIQLAAFAGEGRLKLQQFTGPDGVSLISSTSESARTGDKKDSPPLVTNFPYSRGGVVAGNYSAQYSLTDSKGAALPGQDLRLVVTSKKDSNPQSGVLKVNFVLVGPISGSEGIDDSLHSAFDIWKIVYERAGITLDPAWYSFAGPETLPDPRTGNSLYESISTSTRPDAVNLVFGSKLENETNLKDGYHFGRAGAVPGPVSPSGRSVVAFSILEMTGNDGEFDGNPDDPFSTEVHNDETRLAAEEMARLTSQYLGLQDVVTFDGNTVASQDNLSDTATCLNFRSCQNEDDPKHYMMFPFPLAKLGNYDHDGYSTEYYSRDNITAQQSAILNSNVLVE